jgi:hypothetical protein
VLPAATADVPELRFAVTGAERVEHVAVPTLRFTLRLEAPEGVAVRSVLLDTQLQIAARRRPYGPGAHDRLFELFGPVAGWGTTLRTLPWVRTTCVVPAFTHTTLAPLDVVCTYDLEVAAARYFDALDDGEVPLEFLFSGTLFYGTPMQAVRISWESEAEYRMPVALWRETMERHFPDTTWLRLRREAFDRLATYKSRRALATWEDVFDELLEGRE